MTTANPAIASRARSVRRRSRRAGRPEPDHDDVNADPDRQEQHLGVVDPLPHGNGVQGGEADDQHHTRTQHDEDDPYRDADKPADGPCSPVRGEMSGRSLIGSRNRMRPIIGTPPLPPAAARGYLQHRLRGRVDGSARTAISDAAVDEATRARNSYSSFRRRASISRRPMRPPESARGPGRPPLPAGASRRAGCAWPG